MSRIHSRLNKSLSIIFQLGLLDIRSQEEADEEYGKLQTLIEVSA